jgi:hypothetical protein
MIDASEFKVGDIIESDQHEAPAISRILGIYFDIFIVEFAQGHYQPEGRVGYEFYDAGEIKKIDGAGVEFEGTPIVNVFSAGDLVCIRAVEGSEEWLIPRVVLDCFGDKFITQCYYDGDKSEFELHDSIDNGTIEGRKDFENKFRLANEKDLKIIEIVGKIHEKQCPHTLAYSIVMGQ